jgi:hypothetical protein
LIGELIGELGTSHTYVSGGDAGTQVTQVGTGVLGADFTREGDVYKISRIYRGDPADGIRSALDGSRGQRRRGRLHPRGRPSPVREREVVLRRARGTRRQGSGAHRREQGVERKARATSS